jgi:hypothetical protein
MRQLLLVSLCCMLFVCGVPAAVAQSGATQKPKALLLGVTLKSNYARISDLIPRLQESLAKTIPRRRKNISVIALNYSDAEDAAKSKRCDYLLEMNVLEITGGGVGFSTRPPSREMSPQEENERRELGWVRVDYKFTPLTDEGGGVTDMDYVRYLDYPTGWDASAFETTIFRTVSRVAVSTLSNLPMS